MTTLSRYYHLGMLIAALGSGGWACRSKLDVKTSGATTTSSECGSALQGKGKPAATPGVGPAAACPDLPDEPTATETSTATETAATETATETDTADEPVPTEMADKFLLQSQKTHFQTRDVIAVRIPKSMIDGGSAYRILNVTKEDAEQPEVLSLLDEQIDAASASLRSSWSRKKRMAIVAQGDHYVFAFYPGRDAWKGKFYYGQNKLKLEVDDAANPRFSFLPVITLKDFEVFGFAITSFGNNTQVAAVDGGGEFQGWGNLLSAPTVTVHADPADTNSAVVSKLTTGIFNMINPH